MAFCPKCGNYNADDAAFCGSCGAPLKSGVPAWSAESVPPYPVGGMMAWAIVTLLLCTIPGIVAIVKVSGINKSVTVAEQQQKIASARTWCIIGTVLGILAVIGSLVTQNM